MTASSTLAPSAAQVAAGIGAWTVLVVGAGVLVLGRLLAGRHWLDRWALLPPAGVASIFLFHQVVDLFDLTVRPAWMVAWLGASWLPGFVMTRRSSRRSTAQEMADESRPAPWLAPALVGIAAAALVLWFVAVNGPRIAPAQADNARHGFFVARIIETGTNEASVVLVDDLRSGEHSATYYPLGLHTTAAVIVQATSLPVPAVLSGMAITMSTIALVPGLALLARRLTADDTVAAVTALVGAMALPFPFEPFDWGGLPMIAGLCLAPVAAVEVARCCDAPWQRAAPVTAAVALTGCYGAHNTQALVAVAVALALVSIPIRRTGRHQLRSLGAAAALTIALCSVDLAGFARGIGERTNAKVLDDPGAWAFMRYVVTFAADRPLVPILVNAAAVVGLVMLWRRGARRFVAIVGVLMALCALAAESQGPVARAITMPWYGFANRLSTTAQLLVAPAIALCLVVALRRLPRPPIAGGVLALLVLPGLSSMWLIRAQDASAVGPEQLAAFDHLATVAAPGEAVLTEDADDGGMWMYALEGVTPLFGFPVEYHEPGPYWRSNLELLELVADPSSDPAAVRATAQARCVSLVFATDHPNAPTDRVMDRARLRTAPFLSEELSLTTVSVFRIDGVRADGCVPEVLS